MDQVLVDGVHADVLLGRDCEHCRTVHECKLPDMPHHIIKLISSCLGAPLIHLLTLVTNNHQWHAEVNRQHSLF